MKRYTSYIKRLHKEVQIRCATLLRVLEITEMTTATAYQGLLQKYAPRLIRNERDHKRMLRDIGELMTHPKLSAAENELLNLLIHLVTQHEEPIDPMPDVPPDRMLAHLIEAKGVSQSEVAKAIGIPRSTISDVLTGRRQISKAN
ncbi:hypothetical protein LCGC14_2537600, partial [marine sediment metagenome]